MHGVERDEATLVASYNLARGTTRFRLDQGQGHAVLLDLHDGSTDTALFKQICRSDLPRYDVAFVDDGEQRGNAERLVLENADFGHVGLLEMRSPAGAGLGF